MSFQNHRAARSRSMVPAFLLTVLLAAGCGAEVSVAPAAADSAQGQPTASTKVPRRAYRCTGGRPIVTVKDARTATVTCPSGEMPRVEIRYVETSLVEDTVDAQVVPVGR
jgi:hypothetical protein